MKNITSLGSIETKPIKFSGDLKAFEQGQLCYVVARRFQGKGAVKLILHEATIPDGRNGFVSGFGYGTGKTWVVSPGTLTGMSNSPAKAKSSRTNGKLGGRPQNDPKSKETP